MQNFPWKIVDQQDVKDKAVLVRVDYNVPLDAGEIVDDFRIRSSLPLIQNLLDWGASRVILISHLGRPGGRDLSLSLQPVAYHLSDLLKKAVYLFDLDAGDFNPGAKISLLENIRFYPGEAEDGQEFVRHLVELTSAEIFVEDGFSVAHRATATTTTICQVLPSFASAALAEEYSLITEFVNQPKRPLVAILGGAKISDKADFVAKLADRADQILLGGALASLFLAAARPELEGVLKPSLLEPDMLPLAARILDKFSDKIILPKDVLAGENLTTEEFVNYKLTDLSAGLVIGDIGEETAMKYQQIIKQAGSVLWNGTLGVTENPALARGSQAVLNALAAGAAPVLVGGGDTGGFVNQQLAGQSPKHFLISTGGGAMLELVAHGRLPGVDCLLKS